VEHTTATAASPHIAVCLALTKAISNSRTVEEIYEVALDALEQGLQVSRASIQLFDPDGVMRFKAFAACRRLTDLRSPVTRRGRRTAPTSTRSSWRT
jgi:GAF domain-containing protein